MADTSRSRKLGIGAAVVLVLVAGGLWWFFDRDVPEAVSLEGALAAASTAAPATTTSSTTAATSTTAGDPSPPPASEAAAGDELDISRTWSVDTSIGDFSFDTATGTFVGFRIAEELRGVGATEAVGRTPAVSGTMDIDGSTVTSLAIEADLTRIVTDDSRRDRAVQRALETGTFPTASFVLTQPIELAGLPEPGTAITATAIGELTVHGITRPVEVPVEAQLVILEDGTPAIVVVGSFDVTFADFDVEVPSAPVLLSAEDHGTVELQLWFR